MTSGDRELEQRQQRLGRDLLALAFAILLVAGLRNIAGPWETGMRGQAASTYTEGAVVHHLEHGLAVTQGMPSFIVMVDGQLVRYVNWHHPPAYWLYTTAFAWLFGLHTWVLRLAQLILFLPGLLALFAIVRRKAGPVVAGVAALLFATSPLLAYFGPMVLQDGAVLGVGLVACWSFLGHVQAPARASWWRTAALFFAVASLDFPGYFWGLAMFALALAEPRRGPAMRSALSLFPVALVALAVTACHYGLELGGPLQYLREMLALAAQEGRAAQQTDLWTRAGGAVHELFVVHRAGGLFFMALLGLLLAPLRRSSTVARIAWLGGGLLLPGLCNYALFLPHALHHVFWSMHGGAGLSVLAAIPAIVGRDLWSTGHGRARAAGAGLLLLTAATAVTGTVWTHQVIARFAADPTGTPALIHSVQPLLHGCAVALTSAPVASQTHFRGTMVLGGIDEEAEFELMLGIARNQRYPGDVAFVLHPLHRESALRLRLDQLATPMVQGDVLVYRFRP